MVAGMGSSAPHNLDKDKWKRMDRKSMNTKLHSWERVELWDGSQVRGGTAGDGQTDPLWWRESVEAKLMIYCSIYAHEQPRALGSDR